MNYLSKLSLKKKGVFIEIPAMFVPSREASILEAVTT